MQSPYPPESNDWIKPFTELYENAVQRFSTGIRQVDQLFSAEDIHVLSSIGATPQEMYDFIEDWHDDGEPDKDTVLRITAVRRQYFMTEQQGRPSSHTVSMNTLPPKSAALGGIRWLPRIIQKAQAKLRGEMPPELMYGCGGDRPFLKKHGIDPADFLRVVWDTNGDQQRILEFVQQRQAQYIP
ncbi:MAG: DUF5069 domain-containing protein [Nitrospirales bacterium]|nr:DUF5069 domain-containing protein [Nitrospira sp.]MDR4501983.1 DUF5069 domain-containing protein [Nitrospirales bacterium]